MATKNFFFTLLFLVGCATHPKIKTEDGVVLPQEQPQPVEAPKPVIVEKPIHHVAVVFGPGHARSFAELGVLKELLRSRVPVEAVVGIEWGSLVAALYAQNGQIHDAEWKLYKLENKESSHSFFSKPKDPLIHFYQDNLKGRSIEQSPVRFFCADLKDFSLQDRGEFSETLKKCVDTMTAPPPLTFVADLVQNLRSQNFDILIYIDVLKTPAQGIEAYSQIKGQLLKANMFDEAFLIATPGIDLAETQKRREAIVIGEKASRKQAQAIAKKYGF